MRTRVKNHLAPNFLGPIYGTRGHVRLRSFRPTRSSEDSARSGAKQKIGCGSSSSKEVSRTRDVFARSFLPTRRNPFRMKRRDGLDRPPLYVWTDLGFSWSNVGLGWDEESWNCIDVQRDVRVDPIGSEVLYQWFQVFQDAFQPEYFCRLLFLQSRGEQVMTGNFNQLV